MNPLNLKNTVKPKYTTIDSKHFEPIIQGMHKAYTDGTARGAQMEGINIGAKQELRRTTFV